ncbi:hypothetical protein HH303_06425 [Rhodospirillaceae bacterium KN72]|uniref:Phytanoyl-CoA dioxygenase n=1 Tax=Pacificispira spongiicola TaxID=2729598 RepID=A0A7Y0DYS6_9PROT|nr:hypothetical protein [Pacificispira spongiicola]NMM44104.1 hypothetical protein [Pacificispira spongiicola]
MLSQFLETGWVRFPFDPALRDWLTRSGPAIQATLTDPDNAEWWRYGDTWFAGVNVLPNDARGAVPGGLSLSGLAVDFVRDGLGFSGDWEPGQVSVCRSGYPRPAPDESAAVYAFRRDRDAAHIDGLLREGPDRRRFLREYHAFVLGIPATDHPAEAAPFTVWEGSHCLIGDWLRQTFTGIPPGDWDAIDLTDGYHATRKQIFDTCKRVTVAAKPGEAYLVHRHALHGMAPWPQDLGSRGIGDRTIVYFRPEPADRLSWLSDDNIRP